MINKVINGLEWQWTAGEAPVDVGLDDIALDKSLDNYPALLEAWHFLDAFVDVRWHGLRNVDGISWENATVRLAEIIDWHSC